MDHYFCLLPSLLCFVSPRSSSYSFISRLEFAHYCLCRGECRKWASCGRAPGGSGFPHGILQTLSRHQDSKSRNLAPSSTQRLRSPTSGLKKLTLTGMQTATLGARAVAPEPHLGTERGRCESVPWCTRLKRAVRSLWITPSLFLRRW